MAVIKENKMDEGQYYYPKHSPIIIGGGQAGAVLANSLSKNLAFRILFLEAGEALSEDHYPELRANSQIIAERSVTLLFKATLAV